MYQYRATFQRLCTSFTMPHIPNHNIHSSNLFVQTTVLRFNTHLNLTIHHSCLLLVKKAYNKSLELFCFMLVLSTTLCSLHSIHFLLHNKNPPCQLIKTSPNFSTMLPLILTPQSDIMAVRWFYMYTVMHPFSVNQTQIVG